jgi:UDP-glucose 4-epimerase
MRRLPCGVVRVLITGGAGFIGANLARHLAAADWVAEVRVLDDLSSGDAANLDGVDVDLRAASILDRDALADAAAGVDAIVHLAAVPSVPRSVADPVTSHEANATGTLRVLEAARAAGGVHVVLASSSSVYGANPSLPKHEGLRPEPLSPYAVSKLATEAYASAYASCYGLPVLALRFFNVFGPLQPARHAYAAVIPAFVDAAIRGVPLPIHGDGHQSRDFTAVASVAAVLADAVRRRVTSDYAVNLAFGSRQTLLEVVGELSAVVGTELQVEHLPVRAGDVRHSQADQTRLRELFPDIEPVAFRDGLRATVDWFRGHAP